MLAMAVLVLQSVVTSAVYATDIADPSEETVPETAVETEVDDGVSDESNDDEVVTDLNSTVSFPAVDFEESVDLLNVKASADEWIFPEGTTMIVTPIETSEAESIAKDELWDVVKTAIWVDISFENADGEEIEPADEQNVRVSISLINRPFAKEVTEDNVAVVHQDNDGNTESIENVEVEKGYSIAKAEFDHNQFSVFVVAIIGDEAWEDENAICTYNFKNWDVVLNTQLVKNGEELVDPGIPSLEKNQEFAWWYNGDTKIEFASSVSCTKTETIDATAKIQNTYYLTFIGSEWEVAWVQKFTVDEWASTEVEFEDVTVVAANNPGEASRVAIGWSKTSDGKTPIEWNTVDVAKVDTLYAIVEEWYRITFNENDGWAGWGASYIWPRSVISGNAASTAKPDDPTRKWYSFDGWYTDPECTTAFNWNNPLTTDITLYAKWTENNNTTYTVIIWKQKVSWEWYDFGESHVWTVATNTEVTDSLYNSYTTKDYEGFSYSRM